VHLMSSEKIFAIFLPTFGCCPDTRKASGLIASDLDTEFDVYVADKEFNWTYVKTHEEEYGPYFCRR